MSFIYFAQVQVGITSAFYDSEHFKIEWSHQICAMQKVSRIFSTKLQFGTLEQTYLKS